MIVTIIGMMVMAIIMVIAVFVVVVVVFVFLVVLFLFFYFSPPPRFFSLFLHPPDSFPAFYRAARPRQGSAMNSGCAFAL
jgi:hypothetical protein